MSAIQDWKARAKIEIESMGFHEYMENSDPETEGFTPNDPIYYVWLEYRSNVKALKKFLGIE